MKKVLGYLGKTAFMPNKKFGKSNMRKGASPLLPDIPAGKNQYSSRAKKEISDKIESIFNLSSKLNDLKKDIKIIIIIGNVNIKPSEKLKKV